MEKIIFNSNMQSILFKFKKIKSIRNKYKFIKNFKNLYWKFNKEINKFQNLFYFLAQKIYKDNDLIIPEYCIFENNFEINDSNNIKELKNLDLYNILNDNFNLDCKWIKLKELEEIFEGNDINNLNFVSINNYLYHLDHDIFFKFIVDIEIVNNQFKDDLNNIIKIFLIFVKKLEILYFYFDKVLNLDKNDLYSQSYDSDIWKNLINNHTKYIVF